MRVKAAENRLQGFLEELGALKINKTDLEVTNAHIKEIKSTFEAVDKKIV